MAIINFLVEGKVDEAVAEKLALAAGHEIGECFGRKGCGYIKKKIVPFNASAKGACFLTLVDLMDTELDCPAAVVSKWLPACHQNMMLRVVVKEIESWILADTESIAKFLHVRQSAIPVEVEKLDDPKRTLIGIALKSQKRDIREALAPLEGTTAKEGILYNDEIIRFVRNYWNPEMARRNSPSLERCIVRLNQFEEK